jgi:hypothetical protein
MASPDWRQQVKESRRRDDQRRQEAGRQGVAPKSDAVEQAKRVHEAMNQYVRSRGGWIVSYSGQREIRLELLEEGADVIVAELESAGFFPHFNSSNLRVTDAGLKQSRIYVVLA